MLNLEAQERFQETFCIYDSEILCRNCL